MGQRASASLNLEAILARLLLSDKSPILPTEARYFLRLKFPESDCRRMRVLSAKAKQGALTEQEDEDLENYTRAGHLLGILQSRARQMLKRATGTS